MSNNVIIVAINNNWLDQCSAGKYAILTKSKLSAKIPEAQRERKATCKASARLKVSELSLGPISCYFPKKKCYKNRCSINI